MAGQEIRKPDDIPSSNSGRWNPLRTLVLDYQAHKDPFGGSITNNSISRFGMHREKMRMWRRQYTYAIPSDNIQYKIIEHCGKNIVEMGAGTGYWAKYLSQFEINVLAFDTVNTRSQFCDDVYYHHVNESGPECLADINDRALLLVWPPYNEPFAYNCLKSYKGNDLIFVGEGYGGCTGDDDFFNLVEAEWKMVHCSYDCLNFYGISSYETIYKRNPILLLEETIY